VRLFDFHHDDGRSLTDWSSTGVRAVGLVRTDVAADVSLLRFDPKAVLGRHPTGCPQIFAVIDGAGWVSGEDGKRNPVATGRAAFWSKGESHESGSETGMTVIIVQAERLDPDERPS